MQIKPIINKLCLFIMTSMWLVIGATHAQASEDEDGIEPYMQELFLGEMAFAQEQAEVQIGVGLNNMTSGDFDLSELTVSFEYGLTDQLEVAFSAPYLFTDGNAGNVNGLGDVELGFLYNVVNNESWVMSVALETSLTTGDEQKGLGEEHGEWAPSLLFATQVGKAQLFFGIGGEFSDGESATTLSAATAFELSGMTAVLELNGEYGDEGDEAYFAAGLVKKMSGNSELQAGLSTGLTDDSADWGFIIKWNIEF